MGYLKFKVHYWLKSWVIWLLLSCALMIGIGTGGVQSILENEDQTYSIGIVDLDQTKQSVALIEALKAHPSLTVILYEDRLESQRGLSDKEILQTYVLLEGFDEKIASGKYSSLVEVVSMIKSPYSDWLNDQISVSVIREWLISDGYQRLKAINPEYPRSVFEEAFDSYYTENELLGFSVINRSQTSKVLQDEPSMIGYGFLWTWCVFVVLIVLWLVRRLYVERTQLIWMRLKLSGINRSQYALEYLWLLATATMLGGALSYGALMAVGHADTLSCFPFVIGLFFMGMAMLTVGYVLTLLPVNKNQLTFIYIGIAFFWSLLNLDVVQLIPAGSVVQYLSPIRIFFQFVI